MRNAFHLHLLLLVLMNITFVHITGAVGLNWLVPMYALTLLSPVLVPLQQNIVYRVVWNVGVLVIFAILLVDAATTGVMFLLEDGLILAAFCQVHLLNVIRRHAGADLLFFNSFLIALVTSLFCRDLAFSAVFAVYAVVLVVTLHLSTVVLTTLPVPVRAVRLMKRDGLRRAFVALAITGCVFAFCPRDFDRRGFVDDDLLAPVDAGEVGFSEEIRLGQSAATPVRQRVVMRIRMVEGDRSAVPELWRGATLSYYDHGGWQGVHLPQDATLGNADADWRASAGGRVWTRTHTQPTVARLRVTCTPPAPQRLFAPLGTHSITLERPSYVEPLVDATLRYNSGAPLSYELALEDAGLGTSEPAHLPGYRQLDAGGVPDEIHDRLREALVGLGPAPEQRAVVAACTDYLSIRFAYLLPGERGAARNLREFVSGEGGGHCEYFATALAVMLRLQSIPCRVVTGYRVCEEDEQDHDFVVRDAHAHAWVEVWDPVSGWVAADATPSAPAVDRAESMWAEALHTVEEWWNALVQFDSASHRAVLAWLLDLPVRLLASLQRPLPLATLLAACALFWLRRHRRRSVLRADAAVRYRAVLRRAGLALAPAETPRELLARAASGDIEGTQLRALRDATAAHERARYAR